VAIGRFPALVVMLLVAAGCAQVNVQPLSAVSATNQSASTANRSPTISGQPSTAIAAGAAYSYRPTVSDADGDVLQFSIDNKPSWATFSLSSGELSGTPGAGATGTTSGIVIRVSDGMASAATPAFSITVTSAPSLPVPPSPTGTATLAWTAPQQNTDGSALRDLAGYWVYRGASAATLSRSVQLTDPATTQYVVSQLPAGTHYFAVTAYNSLGSESALSNVGSKAIP
jgi:hypothetical protein